jgi:hypothetical protein
MSRYPSSPRTRTVTRSWTRGELNQELAKPEESSLAVKYPTSPSSSSFFLSACRRPSPPRTRAMIRS